MVFFALNVTEGDLLGADVLIGMDVINNGDFSVTNHGGVTKFSFRMPSQNHIDFVADGQRQQRPQFQHGGSGKPRPPRPDRSKKKR